MSINKVILVGNLTREPELRTTSSGTNILSFGIAVNDRWFNQQSQSWESKANFVDCVLFGNRANSLATILTQGMKITLEGKLSYSQWKDNNGNNRSKLEVVVNEVELPQKQQQAPQAYQTPPQARQATSVQTPPQPKQAPQPQYQQPPQAVQQPQVVESSIYDEDIPF